MSRMDDTGRLAAADAPDERRRIVAARTRFARCFAALSAGVVAAAAPVHAANLPDYPVMMRAAVDELIASQTSSGLFPYGFDFLADKPLEPERVSPSNLIRQAGTASMLADGHARPWSVAVPRQVMLLLSRLAAQKKGGPAGPPRGETPTTLSRSSPG